MSLTEFNRVNGVPCDCGKEHFVPVKIYSGRHALAKLIPEIEGYKAGKVFLLADEITYKVAGERVKTMLESAGIICICSILDECSEPDEKSVGSAIMHYDASCDLIVAVGSGVVNDIGKIVATTANKPYIIVGTAPSMDGYASASSSMIRDGLKISLPSKSADVIIGDNEILATAPDKMLAAGLGDMLAKYVSICEWRISNLITGEYYCESIASLVRKSLKKCIDNRDGLLLREDAALESVFEGLVTCGAAMAFAGISRPASGVEHNFSHMWDMRSVEFGTAMDLHGIQCAIGTLYSIKAYHALKKKIPNRERALASVADFDFDKWSEELRAFLGKSAEAMIALEGKERKYDKAKHAARLEIIIDKWDEILAIIDEEIPSLEEYEAILDSIKAPKTLPEIGIDPATLPMALKCSKDIRDKYILPKLLWDLGMLDELCEEIF